MTSRSHTSIAAVVGLTLWIVGMSDGTASAQEQESLSSNDLLRLCDDLTADTFEERWAAAQEISSLGKEDIDVIQQRLQSSYTAKPENMRLVLTGLRKKLKDALIADYEARGKKIKPKNIPLDAPPAFLELLVKRRNPNYPAGYKDALEILVLLNALINIGTTESIGIVIDYSPTHEAAFRKEIYQLVLFAGTTAIPAMVRRQNAKNEDMLKVVSTALSEMKMERPGQQVQVKDHRILIEVLEAFGDHRNIDALATVAAFLNSDMDQVRETARTVMRNYGKLGLWTLKKEYKEYTETKADPEWDAARIADELFAKMDVDRMAPLNAKMDSGLKAAQEERFEKMEEIFREILARQPFFGRRTEMIPGFMAYGEQLLSAGELDRAMLMFKVAQRLDAGGEQADTIAARLYLIEGLRSIEEGAPDAYPLRKALEHDPKLEIAKDKLSDVENLDHKRRISRYRILGALGIGSTALIILTLLVIWRLRST